MLDKMAVTQVPMFWPMMMGRAVENVTTPEAERACRIATEAVELWIKAVIAAPTAMPSTGLEKRMNSCWKASSSVKGARALSMDLIPMNSSPRPIRI